MSHPGLGCWRHGSSRAAWAAALLLGLGCGKAWLILTAGVSHARRSGEVGGYIHIYKIYIYIYISIHIYIYIYIYIRRPLQSVPRVRLQPSKSTMPFNIQALAARQQPKQPWMTHASSSPAQDDSCLQQPRLDGAKSDQLFFYRGHSSVQQGSTGRHRAFQAGKPRAPTCPLLPPWALKLMLPPAQECQIAHWSTLSNLVEPTCHPKPSKQ